MQAYNRLGRYDEALKDCDTAIFLDEKSVKAYIHQGKAYTGKAEYGMAIESYNKIMTFNPKQEKIVKGKLYPIHAVTLERKSVYTVFTHVMQWLQLII